MDRVPVWGCVQIGNRISMFEKTTGNKFSGDPESINESKIPKEVYSALKITKDEWKFWLQSC